jgi:hypothetical protein
LLKNILIIKYSLILFFTQLITWWLLFFSPFNIPAHIPKTKINISGICLLLSLSIIIFLSQKESLNSNKQITFIRLVLLGGLVTFFAELAFQSIRFLSLFAETFSEKLYYACRGVLGTTLIAIIISLITATIIKRRNKQALR